MLSAAIMAHPKRADMVTELQADLDRPVKVVWDEINDRHDTGIRAVEAFDPACSHHLVIQDDAVVPRDLLAGIERALRYIPQDAPMCLYLGKVRPFAQEINRVVARAQRASWLTMGGIYWGPGIVYPTAHIPALSEWFRGSNVVNYDRRVSTWYALRDATVWYPWPCLVDHRDGESITGHGEGRHAHSFVGADTSALDVDWSGPVVDVPRAPKMDNARQLKIRQAAKAEKLRQRREASDGVSPGGTQPQERPRAPAI